MLLNFFSNLIFFYAILTTNPMVMLMLIVAQGIFLLNKMKNMINSWILIIIMLVYLGGVMVMFIYVNSVMNFTPLKNKTPNIVLTLLFLSSTVELQNTKMNLTTINTNMVFYSEIYGIFFMSMIAIFIFLINNMLKTMKGVINNSL